MGTVTALGSVTAAETASAIGNTLCPTCAGKSVRLGPDPQTAFTVLIQHPQISAMQTKVMTVTGKWDHISFEDSLLPLH